MHPWSSHLLQDEDKDEKKDDKKEDKKSDDKKPSTSDDKKSSEKKDEKDEKKKEPEPTFEILSNPARVLRQQLKVISLNEGSQYVPMKDISIGGIIMVRNSKPGEEELVEPVAGKFNCASTHM